MLVAFNYLVVLDLSDLLKDCCPPLELVVMYAADTTAHENVSPALAMHKFPRLVKEGARRRLGGDIPSR